MMMFGWYIVDFIIFVVVFVLILKSVWGVFVYSVYILMEGFFEGVDYSEIKNFFKNIEGVKDVYDLYIWMIILGLDLLSCYMCVEDEKDCQ